MLDNTPEALTQAEELIALSKAHGMSWWLRYATVLYGCALLKSGQLTEGITVSSQKKGGNGIKQGQLEHE